MTEKDLLKTIHNENKAINRNIQRIADIGLIGLLGNISRESDDETGKKIAKIGLLLIMISEVLLLVCDIIDYRKAKIEKIDLDED